MELPFADFQTLLLWVGGTAVAGVVASLIQEWLKRRGIEWYDHVDGRVTAAVLAILATGTVYVLQFVLGVVVFPALGSENELLKALVSYLLVLVFGQAAYGMAVKQRQQA